MARFLVTGGCGFIGSHIADALAARGDEVRVLDDLSTGKRENLAPGAELVVGDIADFSAVERAVDGMDGIFHLAAIASVDASRRAWVRCNAVNLAGTIHVFEAARRQSVQPRVVYASSAAVYGDSGENPLDERMFPRPINAYGADKLGCELHGRVATLLHAVPTIGLRLFNVYGPRQDPSSPYSGVISIFAERLKHGAPLTVYGDGRQVRDFIAVADVVEFFLSAMKVEQGIGEAFNVCTGRGTTISELAATLGRVLGRTPEVVHAPARPGDIRVSTGNPSRAAHVLGQTARLNLHEGLQRLLEHRS
jgi:UDP-glucose 4-epimerase